MSISVVRIGAKGKGDFAAPGSQDAYWPIEFNASRKMIDAGPLHISSETTHGTAKVWRDKMGTWQAAQVEPPISPSAGSSVNASQSSSSYQQALDPIVELERNVDKAWAQVQTVYQRRADLIPNIVVTVAAAADFPPPILAAVTNARASVAQAPFDPNKAPTEAAQLAQFNQAQLQLSNALSRLLVVSERYPELKANQNFQQLQAQLEGTENRISVERSNYNEAVQKYNAAVSSSLQRRPFFAASSPPPTVNFNFGNSTATPAP